MKTYELITKLVEEKSGLNVKVNVVISVETLKALLQEAKDDGGVGNSVVVALTGNIYDITDEEIIFEAVEEK
jgi:hypothetical protein